MKPRALMLLGPTASGKTSVALSLARDYPVEIISVDSALIYRGMDIGSAKPTPEERALCPHHLIDVREISEPYSAADFRTDATRLIDAIASRAKIPLIVGGTMLYAKALREGIDKLPSTDDAIRREVLEEGATLGWPAMHEKLQRVDPVLAARLKPNDAQRIARALEVYRMTGTPLSAWQKGNKEVDTSIVTIGLMPEDRVKLHAAIKTRFMAMLEAGFLEEVKTLMARPDFNADLPALKSVGYRQAIEFLQGKVDKDTFIEKALAATRQLAKRQMTWLRSMPEVTLLEPYALKQTEVLLSLKKALKKLTV